MMMTTTTTMMMVVTMLLTSRQDKSMLMVDKDHASDKAVFQWQLHVMNLSLSSA